MASKITQGRELFNAWALAFRTQQRMIDSPQWERYDRAEQRAYDTLIDTVEASHETDSCVCLACQMWRSDSPAELLKGN